MSDKYARADDCKEVHGKLDDKLTTLQLDVSHMKGKLDTYIDEQRQQKQASSDWWSRVIAVVACILAFFKGG